MKTLQRWVTLVQSVLTCLAIVIGGIWAYYTFFSSQSPWAIVNTELLKEHCTARGALDIRIVDDSKSYPSQKGVIVGHIEIKNVGTRPVTLQLGNYPAIRIAKIDFETDGKVTQRTISNGVDIELYRAPSLVPKADDAGSSVSTQPINAINILPRATKRQPFVVRVPSNNWYMIDFWGGDREMMSEDSSCKRNSDDERRLQGYAWEGTAIFHVD
jgi:hypothetical protein